jgi:1,4-alpha-glucan branching enzyme
MGWMHDTLLFFRSDPIYRSFNHGNLTFSLLYAFSERFILPFSHDEVVHLKKSMLSKMPGDAWQMFANARLIYGYQWSHPGKKLLFMGAEIGQWQEWSEARSLDWSLLEGDPRHRGLQDFMRELNKVYTSQAPLYEQDYSWDGFYWVELHDSQRSILAFARRAPSSGETILVVCNFTPVVRHDYRLGVPAQGVYAEILNSDSSAFGGSNVVNNPRESSAAPWQNQPNSITFTLPPLAIVYWKKQPELAAAIVESANAQSKDPVSD